MSCAKQDIKTDKDDDERGREGRESSLPPLLLGPFQGTCVPVLPVSPFFVAVGRRVQTGRQWKWPNVISSNRVLWPWQMALRCCCLLSLVMAVNDVLIGRLLAASFALTLALLLSISNGCRRGCCSNSCTIDTLRAMLHWTLRVTGHWPVVSANDSQR